MVKKYPIYVVLSLRSKFIIAQLTCFVNPKSKMIQIFAGTSVAIEFADDGIDTETLRNFIGGG